MFVLHIISDFQSEHCSRFVEVLLTCDSSLGVQELEDLLRDDAMACLASLLWQSRDWSLAVGGRVEVGQLDQPGKTGRLYCRNYGEDGHVELQCRVQGPHYHFVTLISFI